MPRLYGYGLRNDPPGNEVSAAYMLVDEMPGTTLLLKEPAPSDEQLRTVYGQWAHPLYVLHAHSFEEIRLVISSCRRPFYAHEVSSSEQKERVIGQLAEILMEIARHPLPLAGSLVMGNNSSSSSKNRVNDDINLSAIASNRFVALNTYGPFSSTSDYLTSMIDQYMDLIADGPSLRSIPILPPFCART